MNLASLLRTNRASCDALLLVLRVALALVIFPHGAQKMLGWYGGHGFAESLRGLTEHLRIPPVLAVLAILAEFVGSLLVLVGALTRLAALAISVNMAVAALTVHLPNGFFMNWNGQQRGEGVEYFIYALAIGLTLIVAGGGRLSLDARLAPERRRSDDTTSIA